MYSLILYFFCVVACTASVTSSVETNPYVLNEYFYYLSKNPNSTPVDTTLIEKQMSEFTFDSDQPEPQEDTDMYKSLDKADLSFYYNFFLTKLPHKSSEVTPNTSITNQMLQIERQLKINKNRLKQRNMARQEMIEKANIYLTTLICFSGIIGNILSLKVFLSTKLAITSSTTYLIALTITDSLFLIEHFLEVTCREIMVHFEIDFPLNLIDQKVTICRSFSLIRSACRCASPWIIVAFTLDRFVVVNYPIYSSIISRPRTARRLVCMILAMSVLVSIYSPVLSGIVYYPKKNSLSNRLYRLYISSEYETSMFKQMNLEERFFEKSCDILKNYRKFYIYLTLVYTVIVVVTPLVIISIFNTLIIVRLYQESDKWTSAKLRIHEQEMNYKELRDKKVQIENFKMTWMLLIISVTFILLTLPHTFLYFIWTLPKIGNSSSPKSIFFFNISKNVMKFTELLYILNHSINFFLYTVTRNSFRKVLKRQLTLTCFKKMREYSGIHWTKNISTWSRQKSSKKPQAASAKLSRKMTKKRDTETLPTAINLTTLDTRNTEVDKKGINYESYWETVPLKK